MLFAYFCVYETKGLSLEQVDLMFGQTSARLSSKWKPDQAGGNRDVEMAEPQQEPKEDAVPDSNSMESGRS